ncbi:MAG: hypothetical protein WA055_00110 [Candidatus Moraniibacteriota bacterium]
MNISEKDIILSTGDLPRLIILCGPCRTGTTALSNVFVRTGIESHMQPIKSIRRAKAEGNDEMVQWTIKNNPTGIIFSKETFGESHPSEFFNPIDDLLKIGYPKDKMEVVFILRDPRQTFASWKRMWEEKATIENLKKSFLLTDEVRRSCCDSQIPHSIMVHEAIRDNCPKTIVSKLFQKLNLHDYTNNFTDWQKSPKFGDSDPQNSHLFFYDSPPEKFIEGVRDRGSYLFQELPVNLKDKTECETCPDLFEVYDLFRKLCEKDLDIHINPLN